MKKVSVYVLHIPLLLVSNILIAGYTQENITNKKPSQSLSKTQRIKKSRTKEFLRLAKKYNFTNDCPDLLFFLVKKGLRSHLLRVYPHNLEKRYNGKTILFIAVEDACKKAQKVNNIEDDLRIIQRLLEFGSNVNARDNNNWQTPLHVAAHYGHEKIIQLLRAYGADRYLTDVHNNRPIDLAQNNKVIQDLIESDFKKEPIPEGSSRHSLARRTREALLTLPNDSNIELYKLHKQSAPLFIAVERGLIQHLIALLGCRENKSQINTHLQNQSYNKKFTGISPLHLAVIHACKHAKKGNIDQYAIHKQIIDLLLSHGADIHSQTNLGRTPLHIAVLLNNPEITALLMQYGANPLIEDYKDKTAYDLCTTKKVEKVLNKLNQKTDKQQFNIPFNKRNLALEFIKSIPKTLDLKRYNKKKNALLHIACVAGAKNNLKLVLPNHKHLINHKICGETPLMAATKKYVNKDKNTSRNIRFSIINLLLKHGAYINTQDHAGNTPLHYAVQSNDIKLVKTLYKYNPDVLKRNKKGKTPLALAQKLENQTIYREFKDLITDKEKPNSPFINQQQKDPKQAKQYPVTPSAPPIATQNTDHQYNLYPTLVELDETSQSSQPTQVNDSLLHNPFEDIPVSEHTNQSTFSNRFLDVNDLPPLYEPEQEKHDQLVEVD